MTAWLLMIACNSNTGVPAIYDDARPEHYFDKPFPSDDLLDSRGLPDLEGYPLANTDVANGLLEGWRDRIELTSVGFGNNTAAYFRFEDALDVPSSTTGSPEDGLLWVDLDEPELLPLEVRFIADPAGDPAYGENTLAMAPLLGHPPRSGHRYAAVVMGSAGVMTPDAYEVPDEVTDALREVGVRGRVGVATVFTVQDGTGQLRALAADVDSRLGDWGDINFRRVSTLSYGQGTTPSGNDSTLATVTYEDGQTSVAYLEAGADLEPFSLDLMNDWPMVVYEAEIPVLNYQGLAERPFMSPGFRHISDNDVQTGWIHFEGDDLMSVPEVEMMRISVQIPKDASGAAITNAPVVIWDHGTSGHAYNILHRRNPSDDGRGLTDAFATAGYAVIGRDATLYGTRYPLIDEGYGGSLGFYNIVNAPAFRDNQRQTALEGLIVQRYVTQAINGDLPSGSIDTDHIRRAGHSLGAVTTNLGLAMAPDDFESGFLSGTGGVFLHYFFDTGLLAGIDQSLIGSLLGVVGAEPPAEGDITTTYILGAALGLEEEAIAHVDRLHPAPTLFQWQMDPSDPMAVARDETLPIQAVIAPGDFQTPDFTAEALVNALPNATFTECNAMGDYDPHSCMWREPTGIPILSEWLNTDY